MLERIFPEDPEELFGLIFQTSRRYFLRILLRSLREVEVPHPFTNRAPLKTHPTVLPCPR